MSRVPAFRRLRRRGSVRISSFPGPPPGCHLGGRKPGIDQHKITAKKDRRAAGYFAFSASAATCIFTILSGFVTLPLRAGSPFLIWSIYSMPEVTLPQIVYCPSSEGAGPNMIKNWLSALFGALARAIEGKIGRAHV